MKPMHSLPRKPLIVAIITVILVVIGLWRYSEYFPSTDNAYVEANLVTVSVQVTGPVQSLRVQNHQAVKAGQLLFTIDPKPFQVALDSAQAAYELAKQEVTANAAAVETAESLVKQREVEALNSAQNGHRSLVLAAQGVLPRQSADDARADIEDRKALLKGSMAQLKQAKAQLGKEGELNAKLLQAKAAVEQARLSLTYTGVFSPVDGVIENLSLRTGDMATVAEPLFSIVDNSQWWVEANFKETQLTRIRPGQHVKVELDMYGDHDFDGVVETIAAGSGSLFSLLPPENATGNWVKTTQRFPVRIRVKNDDDRYPLRAGASASVRVNTLSQWL